MTTARARAHSTGRPPGKDGAGRRSPGRARFTGLLLILLSLTSAAASYSVFSWWLPSDHERYQDCRAAEQCSSRALERGRTDCLSTWHLTPADTSPTRSSAPLTLSGRARSEPARRS